MANNKQESERPELSFAEVYEQHKFKVADLIFLGATGELTIYVKAEGWKVAYILSISQAFGCIFPESKHKLNDELFEALFPEYMNLKSLDDFCEKVDAVFKRVYAEYENSFPAEDFQEIISTRFMSFYPNNGIYRAIYLPPITGFQPISATAIKFFRNGVDVGIWLKLIDFMGISKNSKDEFIIFPEPLNYIQDTIDKNKLFVMKADLQRVFSNESLVSDSAMTQDVTHEKKVKGPRPETDARYKEWQRMADELVKNKPQLKSVSAIAKSIYRVVQNGNPKYFGTERTIREHIKINN